MRLCVLLMFFAIFNKATSFITTPPAPSVNCGYESCHATKEDFVNVHIVPHTHDDVGWLKTVDQYYYGSRSNIQKAGVQYILDSIVDALRKNPDRRFIYVETAFFWKWWIKQHDFVKSYVRKLVNSGQLEFIGGAWSMNDEATTHYQSIVDQFTWGLRKLNDSFGTCGQPKVGWQIDPFGHSREMASIFAQLGFDGLLLGRIDYQDKNFRFKTKTAEVVWEGSDNLGPSADLFTSVMYNTYAPPPGFCFDILCNDEPIIDDPKSAEYNVPRRVKEFFTYLNNVTQSYITNNIIITMGEDFNYQDADVWFKNIDKLILYGNQLQANDSKYNLIYSTPSCYLKAVYDEAKRKKIEWPVKHDDYFPYASDPHAFWTGYFTSRPTLKRFERVGNNYLQVCKQLYALTDLGPEDRVDLNVMREAMGVMQHHDAVTGTEKEHVAHDYAKLLQKGLNECNIITSTALNNIIKSKSNSNPGVNIPFVDCPLLNISQCWFTEKVEPSGAFVVTVYNPLSRPVNHYVRLPVNGRAYTVTDPNGNRIETQLLPIATSVLNIPGRFSSATVELIFEANELPPLGFKSYYVNETEGDQLIKAENLKDHNYGDIGFIIDEENGLLSSVTMNGKQIPISQELLYYKGTVGNNAEYKNRSSGAYIFRPNGTIAYKLSETVNTQIFRGPLISEVHQIFNDWVSQIIRIYKQENYIEFDWLVGPIPVNDVNGKEVISRFTTQLNSNGIFYTDSNGREILKRVRNFRPTWKLNLHEPVSGNYYPVTSKILIRDPEQNLEVAILTDRAQGGTSLTDGEIELMVHRNCLHDDSFGVGEPLDEQAFNKGLVARGSHYLIAGPYINSSDRKSLAAQERELAQRKILSAWTFLSPANTLTYEQYKSKYNLQFSGLKRALPDNVQILTLEPWKGMSFLLRLEHVLEKDEDSALSQAVTVDLSNLFSPFEIVSLRETTLGANQWLENNNRLQFSKGKRLQDVLNNYLNKRKHKNINEMDIVLMEQEINAFSEGLTKYETNPFNNNDVNRKHHLYQNINKNVMDPFKITLTPMQIRTFVIEINKNLNY